MAWTEITHPKYERDGLRYASDTTDDEEWALLSKLRSSTVCMNRHIAARRIYGAARASCGFKPRPYMIRKRPIVYKAGTSVPAMLSTSWISFRRICPPR